MNMHIQRVNVNRLNSIKTISLLRVNMIRKLDHQSIHIAKYNDHNHDKWQKKKRNPTRWYYIDCFVCTCKLCIIIIINKIKGTTWFSNHRFFLFRSHEILTGMIDDVKKTVIIKNGKYAILHSFISSKKCKYLLSFFVFFVLTRCTECIIILCQINVIIKLRYFFTLYELVVN